MAEPCVHQYNYCLDCVAYTTYPMLLGLTCMKCGHNEWVPEDERWQTILQSWRDNGLDPRDWEDVDEQCALK